MPVPKAAQGLAETQNLKSLVVGPRTNYGRISNTVTRLKPSRLEISAH